MARFWIGATGLTFLGFGLYFLLFTTAAASHVEIELPTAMARTEMASFYGGLEIGIGAFLIAAALRPAWHRPALWCIALGLGTTAVVRLVMTATGAPHWLLWALGSGEVIAAAGSLLLLRKLAGKPARVGSEPFAG